MVRFTSASLAFLGAIGSALAQRQSILVGFSSQAGLDAVLERVTPPGAATAGSPGSNVDAPKMFRRPLKVAARAQADVDTAAFLVASDFPAKPPKGRGPPGRKLPGRNGYNGNGNGNNGGNAPGPVEPVAELTLGYVKVDFTNEDGAPTYADNADIAEEIDALSMIPGVTVAELDGEVKALGFPTDAEGKKDQSGSLRGQMERILAENKPWGIDMVNITQFWAGGSQAPSTDPQPVKICIIDTGYDLGHEDLPKASDGVTGFKPSGMSGAWDVDGNDHGTHVAGTIGAIGSNGKGVVGVMPDPSKFTFHIGKGLSDGGSGSTDGIIDCVEDCVSKGADVISMSLGGSGYSSLANSAYEAAYDADVLVIAAAGNDGREVYGYPASYASVMSVASVTEGSGPNSNNYGPLSSFSTRNDQLEIAGPGSDVLSTIPDDKYSSFSGTSMATPHVAAVAAWLISYFPNCAKHQIRNAMLNAVREPPRSDDGWDKLYGHGIVDAGAAYSLLSSAAGCEGAGGLSPDDLNMAPSVMAKGGAYQRDIGCTIDAHCYIGPNTAARSCNTGTKTCETAPFVCEGANVKVQVDVTADNYPAETSFKIRDKCNNDDVVQSKDIFSAGSWSGTYCMSAGQYEFEISDSYGDGLCCAYGSGSYTVHMDDAKVAEGGEFGDSEKTTFGSCGGTSTLSPTDAPTNLPTNNPTTPAPVPATANPTNVPTNSPTTPAPTNNPTTPAPVPVTANPTNEPTNNPTTPCNGMTELKVDVTTDEYPGETSFEIRDKSNDGVVESESDFAEVGAGTSWTGTYCMSDGEYEFEIFDSYGDGLCCGYGTGSYAVHMNGDLVVEGGEFAGSEKTPFSTSTLSPTDAPTNLPTGNPTPPPTSDPTGRPTPSPSKNPTPPPTSDPTGRPTPSPSKTPTPPPTSPPTDNPTDEPTPSPTNALTVDPTSPPTPSPVTPTNTTITVKLLLDEYPGETSWSIIDTCEGGGEILSGGSYTEGGQEVTVAKSVRRSRFMMNIIDTYGDGMCCNQGEGKYEVFMDFMGVSPVASGGAFGAMESHFFGDCSDGPQTSKPTGEPASSPLDTTTASDAIMVAVESQVDCSLIGKEMCQVTTGCYWGHPNVFDEASSTRNRFRKEKACHASS